MESRSQQQAWGEPKSLLTQSPFDERFLQEQRRQPRVDTNLGLEASTEKGDFAIAVVSNLSLSGCRLECSRKFIDTIQPNINCEELQPPSKVVLTFPLSPSIGAPPVEVSVRCDIVYTKRLTPSSYRAGCKFIEFYGDSERHLRSHLSNVIHKLAPNRPLASQHPLGTDLTSKATDVEFSEGLSDIHRALVIAVSMKESKDPAVHQLLDDKVLDLIRVLVYAKEHFLKAQETLNTDEKDPLTGLGSGMLDTELPAQLQSTSLTTEELEILLSK